MLRRPARLGVPLGLPLRPDGFSLARWGLRRADGLGLALGWLAFGLNSRTNWLFRRPIGADR